MKISYKEEIQPIVMGGFIGLISSFSGLNAANWEFWILLIVGCIINASGQKIVNR